MKNRKGFLGRGALLLAAVAASQAALAVNYACEGPVNGVTVGPGGTVAAATAGGQSWGYFCQLGATVNGNSPDTCKGILAVLLAAQAQGKQVRIWYNDSFSCEWRASNGAWQYLNTWYWGPSILD